MRAHANQSNEAAEAPAHRPRSAALPWPLSNVAITGIALLLAFAFQGSRALFDPDQGRYADIALQILASHDFITPRVNPEHTHYAKPPLAYWLLAASFATFGRNEWAARVPNALALVLTAACILRLGRCFLPRARLFGFMWIAWGLAFLTKGPPGLLPLLAVFVVQSLRRDMPRLRELASPVGIACIVVVGLTQNSYVPYTTPADTVCNRLGQGWSAVVLVPQALTEQFVSTVRQCHRRAPVLSGKAGRYAVFVDDVRLPGVTASGP